MELKTERKIKFWLSTLAKVLVITLIVFKLVPYLLGEKKQESVTEPRKNVPRDSVYSKAGTAQTPLPLPEPIEKSESGDYGTVSHTDNSVPIDPSPRSEIAPNTLGIAIYSETGLDPAVIQQVEKTVFADFQTVSVPQVTYTKHRQELLASNFNAFKNQMAQIAVGTVRYTLTQKGDRYSCRVALQLNTHNAQTGIKQKDFSGIALAFGIGFSKEQAIEVAVKKINRLE
ncbi:MAG: hypothetical protein AAGA86_16260 [Bacteroidota bacterium]